MNYSTIIRRINHAYEEPPPHSEHHVKLDCFDPLGLKITIAAEILGVSRLTLSNLVNGKNGISPEMAIRLSKAFGGRPEVWLGMQTNYDLARPWQAIKKEASIKVECVPSASDFSV